MPFKIASVTQLFLPLLAQNQLVYEKNVNFISLRPHDRSILLRNITKYVADFDTCFITHHPRLLDNAVLYKSTALANSTHAIDELDFDSTFFKLVFLLLSFFNITNYNL